MKKVNNKKINYFRVFLFILLIISLLLYIKLYVLADEVKSTSIDLPEYVTSNIWYEYGTLNILEFSSGKFKYTTKDDLNNLSSCSRYYYNEDSKIINFNCDNYSMRLVSVSKYKLILVINNTDVMTYYSSLDLTNYLMNNDIVSISDSDIKEIMEDNDFTISKMKNSNVYRNVQLSKLSSINELSIDEYISLKNKNSKAVVLLINPNMSVDAYDLIPIFISWKDKYSKYDFYYVNGLNLKVSDSDILDKDKVLKDYLVGLYGSNVLIFESGDYKRISVDIYKDEDDDKVFNCIDKSCDDIELLVYDNETVYESIDSVLDK